MSGTDTGRLLPDVDYLLERDRSALGTAITASMGGDPLVDPPALGISDDWRVELDRQMHFEADRNVKMNDGVFRNPESRWGEIQAFWKEVQDTYKAQNTENLLKTPRTEEDFVKLSQQMTPVRVDPNRVADMRQAFAKLHTMGRQIDPRFDAYTDPRTAHIGQWINREAGVGEAGYMVSGDQPNQQTRGPVDVAWQGIEGIAEATNSAVAGLMDLGRQSIMLMGGPDVGGGMPTNFIEGDDGKVYTNGAKVPSIMEGILVTWAAATNSNVEAAAAEAGRVEAWEAANRAGFGGLATAVSRLGGNIVGMAPGFGAGAAVGRATFGALTTRGLQALGALRLTKGVESSARALKIIETMSKATGTAAGMAAYEATTQGRLEGYGASYLHGLMMAPVLMALGWAGKKTEWFAQNRMAMPSKAAKAIGGAMEGIGFGGVETIFPETLPAAWDFVRNPNEGTWETYAKNMMAFALVKMGGGALVPDAVANQVRRGIARAGVAEKVARGEMSAEGLPVQDPAKLKQLGEASIRAREAKTPEELGEALKVQREIERLLDIEEMGKGPAEQSVEDYLGEVDEQGLPREQVTVPEGFPATKIPEAMGPRDAIGNQFTEEDINVKRAPMFEESKVPPAERLARRDLEIAVEGAATMGRADIHQTERAIAEQRLGKAAVDEYVAKRLPERVKALAEARAREASSFYRKAEGIEGAEGKPIRPIEGVKPSAEKQLVQEGGREGLEPEKFVDQGEAARKKQERRVAESQDPLEDPRFMDLPKETREAILAEKDPLARKKLFAASAPERRVGGERRGEERPPEPTEQELQQRASEPRSQSGQRAGPQSLQRQPTSQIEPTPGAPRQKASDVILDMQGRPGSEGPRIPFTATRLGSKEGDPVQVPMRSGHMGGRSSLGIFKFFSNLIRTQEGRDLAVSAHEWSHAMHRHMISAGGGREFIKAAKDQVNAALRGPYGPAIVFEMKETLKDYPGSEGMPTWLRWVETWAEWHGRNLLGEVGLDKKLPAISDYMRTWLAAPENAKLRPQYQRIQQGLFRYQAQGSEGRRKSAIASGAAPPTEAERAQRPSWWRRITGAVNRAMLDDQAGMKESQDKWLKAVGRNPEDVSIMEDPARLFDTLRMTVGKVAEHFINRGIKLPGGRHVPGLRSVFKAVKGREADFIDYIVSVRNMDLFSKGKEIQLPPQDYVQGVKEMTQRHPDFPEQLRNLKRWTDALVDYVQLAGNISVEDAQRIKDAYVVYVPFFRAIEGPAQHGQGRGVAERGTGISRIKGSTYEIKDPFVALQQVARSMIAKAHQNQVMSAMFKMSLGHEAGGIADIIERSRVPKDHPIAELLDLIEKKMAPTTSPKGDEISSFIEALKDADALNPQTVTTFTQKVIPTDERSVIAFTPRLTDAEVASLVARGVHKQTIEAVNNRLQWLEVDTKVYESLMGIDKMPGLPERMQPVMQWIQAPRDIVRFFATGVAPGFVAANMLRDALSAPLFTRDGRFRPFGVFYDTIRGAIEYHRNGEMRQLYEEAGVKTSSFWTEGQQRALIGERATLWQKLQRFTDKAQNWFSHPENYIRMAAFKDAYTKAKAENKTEIEARMLALEAGREITVNYARAGWLARIANQTIPYFNAGLQGQRKLWGQLIGGGVDTKGDANKARIQRGAILNGMANITVPAVFLWLMNRDEDWYQDLPEWRKVGYFNMKIGGEIISLPKPFDAGVIFGALPEIMLDRSFGHNPAGLKEAMRGVMGPFADGVGGIIPAFLRPLLEVSTNTNLYTWRPLTPEWISRSSPPEDQQTFYTTETAHVLSKAINGVLSPIELEQILGGHTAGAATQAMRMLDEIAGLKDHPGVAINPMARFTKQQEHGQSSYVDQLYKISVDLEQRETDLTGNEPAYKADVEAAKREISALRKSYRAGEITREEAERKSYELARPLVERGSQ